MHSTKSASIAQSTNIFHNQSLIEENDANSILNLIENIEELYDEERKDIHFVISNYIYEVYKIYCKYLDVPSSSVELMLPTLLENAAVPLDAPFTDTEFTKLINCAVSKNCTNDMKESAILLMDHVINQMG